MTHIVVGGAGIGGLTAALALAQADVSVTLLERRSQFGDIGAGLQLAPNATRILDKLGLLDAIEAVATELQAIRIRRARDASALSTLPLAGSRRRYGAPFLVIHRADLQRVLVAHVNETPLIASALDRRVLSVDHAGSIVSIGVEMTSGPALVAADGFVDAGGLHRSGSEPGPLRNSRLVAWRALVPAAAVSSLYRRPESNLWLGPQTHLVHYPLRGGSLINVVAITRDEGPASRWEGDVWSEPGDRQHLLRSLRGWHPDALQMVEAAPDWRRWPLVDRTAGGRWSNGATTRLGDAAHPMLPFLAQGASQAIEDADALAWALRKPGGVQAGFARYEARRHPRAAWVQTASRRQGHLYHMGRPGSDARDLVMRVIGPHRALARMDWLYQPQEPIESEPL